MIGNAGCQPSERAFDLSAARHDRSEQVASARLREPRGKQCYGLLINLGLVPRFQHGEIVSAFVPRLPTLPAIAFEIVCGRRECVGYAANEVAPSVAVKIDRELDIVARQELGLPELARPGATHLGDAEIAALHDGQRRHQLALEHLGAAAVVRQRGDRANDWLPAYA